MRALERVALLPAHRAYVQRVGRLLVLGLLQLPAVHQLDVGHRRPRRPPSVLVGEPATQRSEDLRPVIVERRCRALTDGEPRLGAFFCGFSLGCDADGAVQRHELEVSGALVFPCYRPCDCSVRRFSW
jgi:hypothetical protein